MPSKPSILGGRNKEDIFTGKGLLVSLCNLAAEINDRANTTPYADQIIKWCETNMHPYNIDAIYSSLNDRFDINGFDAKLVEKDGTFSLSDFSRPLRVCSRKTLRQRIRDGRTTARRE